MSCLRIPFLTPSHESGGCRQAIADHGSIHPTTSMPCTSALMGVATYHSIIACIRSLTGALHARLDHPTASARPRRFARHEPAPSRHRHRAGPGHRGVWPQEVGRCHLRAHDAGFHRSNHGNMVRSASDGERARVTCRGLHRRARHRDTPTNCITAGSRIFTETGPTRKGRCEPWRAFQMPPWTSMSFSHR